MSIIFIKPISKVRKLIRTLGLLFIPCSLTILQYQQPTLSQPSNSTAIEPVDFVCYMRTRDGRIINLLELCNGDDSRSKNPALSTIDQRFLENYQSFMRRRAGGSQSAQDALRKLEQSPSDVVQRAQGVCKAVKSGIPQNPASQSQVDSDLISTMALEYYCPELDE